MEHWHFKVYRGENGESQFQTWYDRQENGVKGQFDGQLFAIAINPNAPETDFLRLPGYPGIVEIVIPIQLSYGEIQVMPIGFWQPDSRDFIIVQCSEMVGDAYDPPEYKALECKQAWELRKGTIYEHTADESDDEE